MPNVRNPLFVVFNPITTLLDQEGGVSVAGTPYAPIILNQFGQLDPSFLANGQSGIAAEILASGAVVNVFQKTSGMYVGQLQVQNAYAAATGTAPSSDPYPVPAVGFITTSAASGSGVTVFFSGSYVYHDPNSEFSATSVGKQVYLSTVTPGGVTLTRPSGGGQLQQSVGNCAGFTAPNLATIAFTVQAQSAGDAFNNITDGTNTTAAMAVGSGASLTVSGTGVIQATQIQAVVVDPASVPTPGQVLTATSGTTADWEDAGGGGGTPGGSSGNIQWNNSGSFDGATNSIVAVSGAVALGNVAHTPVSTTAFTVNASGVIANAQDWYSSNEGFVVASMQTSGLLNIQGLNIQSSISIGSVSGLIVHGGNATSPDLAQFITASGASPISTKTVWIDYNGSLHLLEALFDSTGSVGTSGQVLSSTVTGTAWVTSGGGGTPGGSPTQLQYNLAGAFAGVVGSSVDAHGNISIVPTSGGSVAALTVTDDGVGTNDIADFHHTAGSYNVVAIAQPNNGANAAALTIIPDSNGNNAFFAVDSATDNFQISLTPGFSFYSLADVSGATVGGQAATGESKFGLDFNGNEVSMDVAAATGSRIRMTDQATSSELVILQSLAGQPFIKLNATGAGLVPTISLQTPNAAILTIVPTLAQATWTATLPPNAGSAGYNLATDGTGVTSWSGAKVTSISTQTTTYLVLSTDHTILGNGIFVITLPIVGLSVGQEFYLKNIGSGTITISSSANIDFSTSTTLTTMGQSITVQWDGTQYWIF